MKELINPVAAEKILVILAIAGPPAGLIIGVLWGLYKRRVVPAAAFGLIAGLLWPLVYLMWRLYNTITNVIGLDKVSNLFVQLAMFAILGMLLGIAAHKLKSLVERLGADN